MGFRFRNFPIYQELRIFIKDIYSLSNRLPRKEQIGLASQVRRAAASSLLNLAEGSMKKSDAELNRFLLISIGSISEIAAISLIEPIDINKNRLSSASDFFIDPSARFKSDEAAALLTCEARPICSFLGSLFESE